MVRLHSGMAWRVVWGLTLQVDPGGSGEAASYRMGWFRTSVDAGVILGGGEAVSYGNSTVRISSGRLVRRCGEMQTKHFVQVHVCVFYRSTSRPVYTSFKS